MAILLTICDADIDADADADDNGDDDGDDDGGHRFISLYNKSASEQTVRITIRLTLEKSALFEVLMTIPPPQVEFIATLSADLTSACPRGCSGTYTMYMCMCIQ